MSNRRRAAGRRSADRAARRADAGEHRGPDGVSDTGKPVLRASSPSSLVSLLPYVLGFHPRDSLVVVALHGPRSRMGPTVRVDLPELGDPVDFLADYIPRAFVHARTDRVVVVAYSGDDTRAARAVHAVLEGFEARDIDIVEALRADGSRWWSYTCDNPHCCPPSGTPYDRHADPLVAEAVLAGLTALPDRESLGRQVMPLPGPARARMEEVTAAVRQRLDGEQQAAGSMSAFVRGRLPWLRGFVRGYAGGPRELTDEEVALLSLLCAHDALRDAAWDLMTRADAASHRRLWQQVVTRCLDPLVPAPACLMGFAAWLGGDGALASHCLERAQSVDDGYSMAGSLQRILVEALPPNVWDSPGDGVVDEPAP